MQQGRDQGDGDGGSLEDIHHLQCGWPFHHPNLAGGTAAGAAGNVKRGWTQQVGIIKTTLLLAVAVTASNLRQLLTWSRSTGDVTDQLTLMEVGPASFEEIDPATRGVGNTGPPAAA